MIVCEIILLCYCVVFIMRLCICITILDTALHMAFPNVKQLSQRYELFLKDCVLTNTGLSVEAEEMFYQVPQSYRAAEEKMFYFVYTL